ncbi:histamine H3 receptor isoform X1 [Saimiri boliviensis]|uniref:histamine H3 receptor isoform X1 n=2 Tax=Saimiri boliviensis TaxID=27679 RepID=UPI003D7883F6
MAGALRGARGAVGRARGALGCALRSGCTVAPAAAPAPAPASLPLQQPRYRPRWAWIHPRPLGTARPGPGPRPADHALGAPRGPRPGRGPTKTRLPGRDPSRPPSSRPAPCPASRSRVSLRGHGARAARRAAERFGGAGGRGGGGGRGARLLGSLDRGAGRAHGAAYRGHGAGQRAGHARLRGRFEPPHPEQLLPAQPRHLRLPRAFCIPLYVPYVLTGRWTFGRGLCKLWLVVDYLLCTSSAFNIVLISYDRFLSVTRAVSYRAQQGDTRRAVRKMLLVWVLAFLLYGPAILSWEYLSGGSAIPEGHCYAEFFYNWYFLITASTLEFFTPFLSVTFFNLSIYLNIQRRTRLRLDGAREAAGPEPPPEAQASPPRPPPGCWGCWRKGHGEAMPLHRYGVGEAAAGAEAGEAALGGGGGGGSAASPTSSSGSSRGTERPRSLKRGSKPSASSASLEKRMKMVSQSFTQRFRLSRDRKVAKSLAVIVSIFGLCWAPYTLLMIIRAACHGHCVPDYWYETSFWLLWVNSAVNPVLYPLCHHSFRRAFTKLLCPQRLKIQPHSSLEQCWK